MECVRPIDGINKALEFACLRQSTVDWLHQTVEPGTISREIKRFITGAWFEVEPVSSIHETVQAVESKYIISPFSYRLLESEHWFYNNTFCREGGHESEVMVRLKTFCPNSRILPYGKSLAVLVEEWIGRCVKNLMQNILLYSVTYTYI